MSENNHLKTFNNQPEFSPMTEISMNLSSTKISHLHTRKRRLSLSLDESECVDINGYEFGGQEYTRKCLQDITNVSTRSLIDSPSRHDGEISLYGGATPETRSPESSPELRTKKCGSRLKSMRTDYFDRTSSLDSGLGCSFQNNEHKSVQFLEPTCTEPKLLELSDFENEFAELEDPKLPINFNSLVSGNILCNRTPNKIDYRTPNKVRSRLFASSPQTTPLNHNKENTDTTRNQEQAFKLLKRSKSLFDSTDKVQQNKRYKNMQGFAEPGLSTPVSKPILRRAISTCSPNTIMTAVQRSAVEPDLIGDFSKPFILPLVSGRHQDLKSITCSTLAKLIRGHYVDKISSFKVIDCRYPYEYQGGHIQGALNYYTKEQIETKLFNLIKDNPISQKADTIVKRDIVIFHCEFSAQRGPKLFRYLRTLDRNHNNDVYPALHYPEIYLLEGGYKRFFEAFSDLCEPVAYKRMNDPDHEEECRHFRAQKRSGNFNVQNSRKLVTKRSALEF